MANLAALCPERSLVMNQTSPDRLISANIPLLADRIIEASENAG